MAWSTPFPPCHTVIKSSRNPPPPSLADVICRQPLRGSPLKKEMIAYLTFLYMSGVYFAMSDLECDGSDSTLSIYTPVFTAHQKIRLTCLE